ncbi:MAG: diaminopimelate decarboxylase, partial [Ktedonobacteraceae bacterium]
MMTKRVPFAKKQLEDIIKHYPTPFHLYDEAGIRRSARALKQAFAWANGFQNYFAVKALPNPSILQIIRQEGFGADCSSLPELVLAERAGFTGEDILLTSNETPVEEYQKARELGALLNLDDLSHLAFLEKHVGLPELLCFRYNPGPLREGNGIIGKPEEAKYGLTREQIFQAYTQAKERGVRRFGLHTMLASNELDPRYFIETASVLFDLLVNISRQVGIRFEFVNFGGGIGIPYRPEQTAFDLERFAREVRRLYQEKIVENDLHPLKIIMECGRLITGPHGYLVTTAIHKKETYKRYIGLDACMTNLM